MVLYDAAKDIVISSCVLRAYTVFKRMKGLLGRKHLADDCCMHLMPCSSIHTFFMQFPIDVLFTDRELRVVHLMENVGRGRMSPIVRKSYSVFELPAGRIKRFRIQLGDRMQLKMEEDDSIV